MITYNEENIVDVMNGATLLASGGGGALDDGLIMLDAFKQQHPTTPIQISVCSPEEMSANSQAVVVAVMGAPSGGTNQDISPCMIHAYEEIKKVAAERGANIQYTLPIEMGGVNTFAPMLISLSSQTPIIDADASGRAVPALDTLLSHINGCETSPVVLANIYGDRAVIETADAHDASRVQSLAVPLVAVFEQNAGIAGWMFTRDNILNAMPNRTVQLARRIGSMIRSAAQNPDAHRDIFQSIDDAGLCKAKSLIQRGKIMNYTTALIDGWDIGDYFVVDEDSSNAVKYHIRFSNESLLLYEVQPDGNEKIVLTAPDIITMYNCDTYHPLTNEDLQTLKGSNKLDTLRVTLGAIQVDSHWWLNRDATKSVWKPYFEHLGYFGNIIQYSW